MCRCGDFRALVESEPFLPLPPFSELSGLINITESEMATLQEVEVSLYKRMGTRRNRRMTKTIDYLLMSQRNHTTFIGIGAGKHTHTHTHTHTRTHMQCTHTR